MKRCYRYRCCARSRAVDPKHPKRDRLCGKRISLPQPVEWYVRVPKCPWCASRKWALDRYRTNKELPRQQCECDGAPYPHRKGTAAKGGRFGAWQCRHWQDPDPVPF